MTRLATVQIVSINELVSKYGAMSFYDAFSRFVVLWRNHQTPRAQLERDAMNVDIPPCLYTTAYALWAKTVTQWTRFMHSHKAEMKRVKLFLRDLTQHSFTAERKTGRVFTVCMRSYKEIHATQWWLFYAAHRVSIALPALCYKACICPPFQEQLFPVIGTVTIFLTNVEAFW